MKFFPSTVTTVLLYGSCTFALTKELEKKLDVCYVKMLRVVKIYQGSNTLERIGKIPKITTINAAQKVRFSRHCWHSKDKLAHQLLLWEATHGKRPRGRPRQTFIDQLVDDTELQKEDLRNVMNDRLY